MNTHPSTETAITKSFVIFMALLMSFIALSIDSMLPALSYIGKDLKVTNPNDVQYVISSIFIGMSVGLLFFGPFSDAYGRKPAIYLGMSIYIIGCIASIFSNDFSHMILGRLLQGLGGACCRVITVSMIRDQFEGRTMAKVMSLVMIAFVLVPSLAPLMGQAILMYSHWRMIFVFMLSLSLFCVIWLFFKQKETHPIEKRIPFSFLNLKEGLIETFSIKKTRYYTITIGFIFGALFGYITSSQQILQEQYQLGKLFPLCFGGLALSIAFSSFANSRLVDFYPLESICKTSLSFISLLSFIFLIYTHQYQGHPPFSIFIVYLFILFFSFGLLFSNLNTLAISPLGHIAGIATSIISSVQTFISAGLGGFIGYMYNGTIYPLILGFLSLSILSLLMIIKASKK